MTTVFGGGFGDVVHFQHQARQRRPKKDDVNGGTPEWFRHAAAKSIELPLRSTSPLAGTRPVRFHDSTAYKMFRRHKHARVSRTSVTQTPT